jgi:hypothetical protein
MQVLRREASLKALTADAHLRDLEQEAAHRTQVLSLLRQRTPRS